ELGPQMKSVGEVMAIGRTFKESLGKALRSMEIGRWGLDLDLGKAPSLDDLKRQIVRPSPERVWQLAEAMRAGLSEAEAFQLTKIDPWFLRNLRQMIDEDEAVRIEGAKTGVALLDDGPALLRRKQLGMSDRRLMKLCNTSEETVCQARLKHGIRPVFKRVDPCAAEFEAQTPYLYSTYETPQEESVDGKAAGENAARPAREER